MYLACMNESKLIQLAKHLDETTNAIDYASVRIDAIHAALVKLVPGFEKEYEAALTDIRGQADMQSLQVSPSPSKGHQVADLIAGLSQQPE